MDPLEVKARITKFWQQAQLYGSTPTEAAQAAVAEAKGSAATPQLLRGQIIPDFDVRLQAVLSRGDEGLRSEEWESFASLFGDFFYVNQILLPQGKQAGVDDACVDLKQLKALYDKIEQGVVKKADDNAMEVDGAPPQRSPAEAVAQHLGDLCTSMSKCGSSSKGTAVSPSGSGRSLPYPASMFGAATSSSSGGYGPASTPSGASGSSPTGGRQDASDENPLSLPGALRVLYMVLFHPCLLDPDRSQETHRLLRGFCGLSERGKEILATWLADLDIEVLRNLLDTIQQYLSITFLESYHESGAPDDDSGTLDDMFVARTSQLCKNALRVMDLIYRANTIRIERRRQYRREELTQGTAAMLDGRGSNTHQVLKFEEFRNDALNESESVLYHDYHHTLYYDFYLAKENPFRLAGRMPQIPKTLAEILERSMENTYTFGLLEYNFCLDASAKCRLLMMNTKDQQREETRQEVMAQVMQGHRRVNPYLVLKVRRDNLIQDTLLKLGSLPPSSYRKSLKIVFEGEQGVDEGGVQKEFFQLLLDQLYDPNYAMFNYNADNKTYWFNLGSFENNLQYELFGALLGIAIYNNVILDIRFPIAVYQKLLAKDSDGYAKFTIDDLLDVSPEMGRSLLQLLEFDGNVQETFCRDFVASYEYFGGEIQVPLKENGENIPVTNENRAEFVELYVDWFFNKSIFDKFRSFKKGFMRCMQPDDVKDKRRVICDASGQNFFLSLFRAAELELLICGSETLDFEALKKNTEYQDGFDRDSPQVSWFWEIVLEDLGEEEKRSLLVFCTGSSRAPPKGLGSPEAKLTIGRQGPDSEALPTAHTCFNHLLIPAYADKDKLRRKLKIAVTNNQGFGLI